MAHPTPFSPPGFAALLAASIALSACGRTDAPSDQVAPAAREAASAAEAIVVPPVPQASEPAASQPAAPASPVSSVSPSAPSTPSTTAADVEGLKLTGAATPAANASAAGGSSPAAGSGGEAPYKVVDGTKVDPVTMEGFRTWRAAACDRCHGANQEGMVGPSLIASLKVLTKEQFKDVILNGRLAKGMPSFKSSETVTKNIDGLYAYLKGRSDGAITEAKVQPIQ